VSDILYLIVCSNKQGAIHFRKRTDLREWSGGTARHRGSIETSISFKSRVPEVRLGGTLIHEALALYFHTCSEQKRKQDVEGKGSSC